MKKIIFFDIDGTLVDQKNKIPKSTLKAIQKLKAEGIVLFLATGRAPALLHHIAEELEINNYISMNGQYIVINGRTYYESPIDKDLVNQVVQRAASHNHGIILCSRNEIYSSTSFSIANTSSRSHHVLKRLTNIVPTRLQVAITRRYMRKHPLPERYQADDILQVILEAPKGQEEEYRKTFTALRFTRSNSFLLDVINKNSSKAAAIQRVLAYYNFNPEDAMAFGDHLNDLEMLEFVGCGVAMGNGHPAAKRVADLVTESNDKGGIEKALVQLKVI